MDFANFASQLNAGTILPEGIVMITLLGVLIVDLILDGHLLAGLDI
jgi:NAD(P)H-quinone oxidoreductase subunit 2